LYLEVAREFILKHLKKKSDLLHITRFLSMRKS